MIKKRKSGKYYKYKIQAYCWNNGEKVPGPCTPCFGTTVNGCRCSVSNVKKIIIKKENTH